MPVPADIRSMAAEETMAGDPPPLPPPSDLDRALDDALRHMPPWVGMALDYPCGHNDGTPWRELVNRGELLQTVALAWQRTVPPQAHPSAKANYGRRLAEALATAVAMGNPQALLAPTLLPAWHEPRRGWWSHEGLRRLVEQLETGMLTGTLRRYACDQLRAHLEAGRMPADIADRAIALVQGRILEEAA